MRFLVSHNGAITAPVNATSPKEAAEMLNLGIRPRITIVSNPETGEEFLYFPPKEDA